MKRTSRRYWIGIYITCIVGFLTLHFLLDLKFFTSLGQFFPFLEKLTTTLAIISIILLIRTVLEHFIDKADHSQGDQYNLQRITRLIASILILFVALSFMFQKPYTALAGLGLVSLVLGFALQAPITSFIAWLYIILRRPYQVGDRIQIDKHRGDVIEISYLDTIIREINGDYIGNDRRSGRIIHFPNSIILTDKVINYYGRESPFIIDETAVQISYTSDLQFVENCLITAAEQDFKTKYPQTRTDRHPSSVYFRVNNYAWLEAVISYSVEPQDTTGRRNRILKIALPLLNSAPDKVGFPEGTRR